MSRDQRDELEDVVASFADSERAGQRVDVVTKSWRFAGISDPGEVRAWIDVGVYDGHRAGLLKMAGVGPAHLAAVPDARKLGLAFALGQVSLSEMKSLIALFTTCATDTTTPQITMVRTRTVDAPASERREHEHEADPDLDLDLDHEREG